MTNADFSTHPIDAFDNRLLFITGKGGVGKSLISSGAASWSAQQGMRTLWVEMSESPKGSYLFPGYRPQYDPTIITDHLSGMNLKLKPAIEEYLEIVFKVPILTKRIARNSLFQVLTTALPGLEALVTLGKIWYEFERTYRGKPYWDRIVVDAPATGHGLSLLRFPQAALDIVQSGPIADRAHDIDRLLSNPQKTNFIIVSLLEELPVDESLELIEKIHQDTPYKVHGIFCNGVYPDIGHDEQKRYAAWLGGGSDKAVAGALGDAESGIRARLNWLESRRGEQQELIPKLQATDLPLYESPWIPAFSEQELLELFVEYLAAK